MPRARNIKPGFFENEHLGVLNSDARLLFAALWTLADKQGVVECRVPRIRTYAFRYRNDIVDADIYRELTVLTRLDNGGMLSKVTHEGVDYLLIHNFVKHASPHHTEKRGDYPDFALLKSLINNDVEKITVNSRNHNGEYPPESLILNTDLLNTDLLKEGAREKKPKIIKTPKTTLEELSTDHIKDWLWQKRLEGRYILHKENEILETFKNYCQSKGKIYADYIAAYKNAFDWDRCQPKTGADSLAQQYEDAARRGEERARNPDF